MIAIAVAVAVAIAIAIAFAHRSYICVTQNDASGSDIALAVSCHLAYQTTTIATLNNQKC